MMGQCSMFAFCFQLKGLVNLWRTMINYESHVLPCSKREFSNVLEGIALESFAGGKLPHPCFPPTLL